MVSYMLLKLDFYIIVFTLQKLWGNRARLYDSNAPKIIVNG